MEHSPEVYVDINYYRPINVKTKAEGFLSSHFYLSLCMITYATFHYKFLSMF